MPYDAGTPQASEGQGKIIADGARALVPSQVLEVVFPDGHGDARPLDCCCLLPFNGYATVKVRVASVDLRAGELESWQPLLLLLEDSLTAREER